MILGIGVDLAKISRFEDMREYQIKRMYSSSELEEAKEYKGKKLAEYFASRFAAKEAFSKALGTGIRGFSLSDISVLNDFRGAPYFNFSDNLSSIVENRKFLLSISHEMDYAIAMVVCDAI